VEWLVTVPKAVTATLTVRFANGTDVVPVHLPLP
jgi:hypothetical protein